MQSVQRKHNLTFGFVVPGSIPGSVSGGSALIVSSMALAAERLARRLLLSVPVKQSMI